MGLCQVANLFTSKRATQAVDVSRPTKRNFFELTFAQKRMATARRELRNYNKMKRELEQVRRINADPPPRLLSPRRASSESRVRSPSRLRRRDQLHAVPPSPM